LAFEKGKLVGLIPRDKVYEKLDVHSVSSYISRIYFINSIMDWDNYFSFLIQISSLTMPSKWH